MVIELRKQMPESFPSLELQQTQDLAGFQRTLNFTYGRLTLGSRAALLPFHLASEEGRTEVTG